MTPAASLGRWFRLPRIDARVVTGVVLAAVSVIGGLRLVGSPAPAIRVYVAAADLEVGHVLTADDLAVGEVRASDRVAAGLARVGTTRAVGRQLRTPLRAGAAVPAGAVGVDPPPGRDLTVPVTPEHALGGAIRAGDRVDLFATFDKGTDVARTLTVARSAIVRGITRGDGLFGQEGGITALTVSVDPSAAIGLAFAARNGELDVVRARGNLEVRARERFDADSLR